VGRCHSQIEGLRFVRGGDYKLKKKKKMILEVTSRSFRRGNHVKPIVTARKGGPRTDKP